MRVQSFQASRGFSLRPKARLVHLGPHGDLLDLLGVLITVVRTWRQFVIKIVWPHHRNHNFSLHTRHLEGCTGTGFSSQRKAKLDAFLRFCFAENTQLHNSMTRKPRKIFWLSSSMIETLFKMEDGGKRSKIIEWRNEEEIDCQTDLARQAPTARKRQDGREQSLSRDERDERHMTTRGRPTWCPHSVLKIFRVRTGWVQGNLIHYIILHTLGIPKM